MYAALIINITAILSIEIYC